MKLTVRGQSAAGYLAVIESDLIPKWEPYWRDRKDGGVLASPIDALLTYLRLSLPHNPYLALTNALVWLSRLTGKQAYRDKGAKLGRFLKSSLRLVNDRCDQNFWDATGE